MAFSIHASTESRAIERPRALRFLWEGQLGQTLREIRRSKQAVIGIAIVSSLVLIALLAPLIAPWNPGLPVLGDQLESPSVAHPFGTDELGRDVFGRVVHGARISLGVAALAIAISVLFGAPLGFVAGYLEGPIGSIIMRLMDAVQAFPGVLLAIAIASTLGPGITNAMIAIGLVGIPGFARLSRSEVLRIKHVEYVTAARACGAGNTRILCRHILPNGIAPLIVAISTGSAGAILTEAALSFVGLGATPPQPSWGSMLQSGYPFMSIAPWLSVFPGLAITLATFGFIFLGDGLRDAFDPKLRGR
jgi:peptide/nickel transport system permease protein